MPDHAVCMMFAFSVHMQLNKLVIVVSDERALVLAARNLGFVFKTRLPDCVSIEVVCIVPRTHTQTHT